MAFSGQSFSSGEILTAAKMNQMDTNVDEIRKAHRGTATPAELTAGVQWIDANVTPRQFKIYDGADFITAFKIDEDKNIAYPRAVGALVSKTGVQSIPNNSSTILTWASEQYDDATIFNSSSNTILRVPGGVGRIEITANILWAGNGSGIRRVQANKNGSTYAGHPLVRRAPPDSTNFGMSIFGAAVDVNSGDRIELSVLQTSGGSLNVVNDNATWFQIVCYA